MSTLKVLFTALFLVMLFLTPDLSKAEKKTGNKTAELNSQIVQEVKEALKIPYLKFADKNLSGEVKVIASVNKDGKIIFKDARGINENLLSNVFARLNSLNLWASPDYSGKDFSYNIKYKD